MKLGTKFPGEAYPKEDIRALFERFIAHCRATGRREQGIMGLRSRIPWFLRWLDANEKDIYTMTLCDAEEYSVWLSSRHTKRGTAVSDRTVAALLVAAHSFCAYLKTSGKLFSNPFHGLKMPRPGKRLPRGIPKEKELEVLLDDLSRFDECRDLKTMKTRYLVHVAAELLYATGMRVSEAAHLELTDIDFARSLVRVRDGKGGCERVAFLGEYGCEVLRLYVERLRPLVFSDWNRRNHALLFGTGWQWFGKKMNAELRVAAQRSGAMTVTCHGFRHAVGSHLLRAGCNIRHIQSILGHKRLRNTEVYTRVEKEDLLSVVNACHPRRWRKGTDRHD